MVHGSVHRIIAGIEVDEIDLVNHCVSVGDTCYGYKGRGEGGDEGEGGEGGRADYWSAKTTLLFGTRPKVRLSVCSTHNADEDYSLGERLIQTRGRVPVPLDG